MQPLTIGGMTAHLPSRTALEMLDHLVLATPDLDRTVDDVERRFGVRASAGGQHRGMGTRNALLSLGERTYLEIVGPDATQPPPPMPRWFGIDTLQAPRLVTWAAHGTSLDALRERAAHAALDQHQLARDGGGWTGPVLHRLGLVAAPGALRGTRTLACIDARHAPRSRERDARVRRRRHHDARC
jgi:Glyoxalase-like domain